MRRNEKLRVVIGAVLLAVVSAPGFLSDRDSTVPLRLTQEARR